jgi:hybrid cluster-associated redox disulfide protein
MYNRDSMERISADTHVEQILANYPALSRVFIESGLPCLVCGEAFWGTVAELCSKNGISVDELLNKLNEAKVKIDEKT